MMNVIRLLRPHQWLKNLFVFAPAFFNGSIADAKYWIPAVTVFSAFSFAASGIYCYNDVYDVEEDRHHPQKRSRPIACGAVSRKMACFLMVICIFLSICIISLFEWPSAEVEISLYSIIIGYVLMNIAYCVWLKQKAIVDVFIIAIGFVFRIFAGGIATGILLSHWLVLLTFLLALFLAFSKRRDDVVMYENTGQIIRKNIVRYNLVFMDQAISVVASIAMVCYVMYTVSLEVMNRFHSPYVYTTSIFVLAGIIRYLKVTIVDLKSGSPTKILVHDRFIQACILCWLLSFVLIIYLNS